MTSNKTFSLTGVSNTVSNSPTRGMSLNTGISVIDALHGLAPTIGDPDDKGNVAGISVNSMLNQWIEQGLRANGVDTSGLYFPRTTAYRAPRETVSTE